MWDAATGRELRILRPVLGEFTACAVSPDGAWIVSAKEDKTLKIWDAAPLSERSATGQELRTLTGHTQLVSRCAVSPDGAWIVSASHDKTLKIWDAAPLSERSATGQELRTLTGHTSAVMACAVSPDGAWIVSGSYDGLKVWDAATGSEMRTLTVHTGCVLGCAVSPDGAWIVSANSDRTLRVWDAATGHERLTLPMLGRLECVALHPWQTIAACGDSGGGFYLLDLVGIEYGPIIVTAARGTQGLVVCCPACQREHILAQQHLGNAFTCPNPECALRLKINPFIVNKQTRWVQPPSPQLRTLTGHTDLVSGCAVSPDGKWIVSTSRDMTLKLWDTASGRELRTLTGHTKDVMGVRLAPTGPGLSLEAMMG